MYRRKEIRLEMERSLLEIADLRPVILDTKKVENELTITLRKKRYMKLQRKAKKAESLKASGTGCMRTIAA